MEHHATRTTGLLAALAVTLALTACDEDGGNNQVCAPGTTQACVCTGGGSGVQTCNASGTGWDPCICSSPDTSTDPDVPTDAPPACTPDGVWDITSTPTAGTCTGAEVQTLPITFSTSGLSIMWIEESGWSSTGSWLPSSCTAQFTQTWNDDSNNHYVWEMVLLFTPTSLTASPASMVTVTALDGTSCTQFYEMMGTKR